MRETIGALDAASRAAQLSSEMMQMNSNPQKWDHDEIHGEALQYYQQLANQKEPNKRKETIEDMVETFRMGATKENLSLIQDFANQSPWKEVPPSAEIVKNMEGVLPTPNIDNIGARTIPSKPIKEVNRDDRKGEDQDVVDRIDASVIASSSSLSNKDEVEKEIIRGKMMKRKEWDDVVDNIEDLLDD